MITPMEKQDKLAKALQFEGAGLYLKREDLHPYGSHKGRSIPVMIDKYIASGYNSFAISSSGNAALAAALYIKELNADDNRKDSSKISLHIFAGKKIAPKKLGKLEALKDENILLTLDERPLQALFIKTQDESIKSLRQSTDDLALLGYESLADELLEIPNLKAIFIGTSSGTTAQALGERFKVSSGKKNNEGIEIHIVQTSSCHPIADTNSSETARDEISIADAIVDHQAIRKNKLIKIIESSKGQAYIASNEDIRIAQELVHKYAGFEISTNSALSIAGLMKAIYAGKKWNGAVACIIAGD